MPLLLTSSWRPCGIATAVLCGLLSFSSPCSADENDIFRFETDLKFDQMFPRVPYSGKAARGMAWSHDGRYLAYLWNPFDEPGFDLYLYDSQTKESKRLTTPKTFEPFDRELPRMLLQINRDNDRRQKLLSMSDREFREFREKEREEEKNRTEPVPTYPGLGEVVWANNSNEMILTYRGDLYRLTLSDSELTRLTDTREGEAQPRYDNDDRSFTYRRGDGVYRVWFDSPRVKQLNPPLPHGMTVGGYSISPDGTKMMISSFRTIGPSRQIDWIVYRDRFAEARKTSRTVADDKFNNESYLFLYDLVDDPRSNPKHDGKPWEIWKYPGGEDYWETSVSDEPWSPDSKLFTFVSWKRDPKDLEVITADIEKRELKTVWRTKSDGEHRSPSLARPFWTPDGTKIVLMLETSGHRNAWLVDPFIEGAMQITNGDYETFPLAMTPDGRFLLVRSGKESPARMMLYRVDMQTGEFQKFGSQVGSYGDPVFSKDRRQAAVSFNNWSMLPETFVVEVDRRASDHQLTTSHRDGFDAINRIKPEIFTYQNRHGHTIYGYMFLPPGYDKSQQRPLMIYVYGGPLGTGKSVVDGAFNSSAYMFNMYLTYVLGYVTVTIDPRGQSGYGAVFGKANWEAPGVAQVEDLSDGVKWLIANYNVDPKKVAINGWSFGGFQTQMCLFTAPDVFTLGIAGAGPTEWQNYNTWYTGGVIGDSQVGKPEDLDKYSLTHMARNLVSPLMLLHGVEDTNVLYQDTVKVYQQLLRWGKGPLVELVIDPTGGHGMGGDMDNRDRHAIYLAYLIKHWGGPYGK